MDLNKLNKLNKLLENLQNTYKTDSLLEGLTLLSKLFQNIINNPREEKYKTIKTANATLKMKLFSIPNIEIALEAANFTFVDGIYVHLQSNTIDLEIVNSIIRNTIQDLSDRTLDPEEYKRRREIKERQKEIDAKYQHEREEAERLKMLSKLDRKEKAQEEQPRGAVQGNELKFGAKTACFKDIGIDVNKQRRG